MYYWYYHYLADLCPVVSTWAQPIGSKIRLRPGSWSGQVSGLTNPFAVYLDFILHNREPLEKIWIRQLNHWSTYLFWCMNDPAVEHMIQKGLWLWPTSSGASHIVFWLALSPIVMENHTRLFGRMWVTNAHGPLRWRCVNMLMDLMACFDLTNTSVGLMPFLFSFSSF